MPFRELLQLRGRENAGRPVRISRLQLLQLFQRFGDILFGQLRRVGRLGIQERRCRSGCAFLSHHGDQFRFLLVGQRQFTR